MSVIIVGAGQAGFQAAASLRSEGFDGAITLIGDEPHAPYQRPPLSKAYLLGKQDASGLLLRPVSFYPEHRIETLFSERVIAIHRQARRVTLASGRQLDYGHLVLATGARVRKLEVEGASLAGVVYLRTRDDSDALRAAIGVAKRVLVIGGGYVGLEIAAAARLSGSAVTVLEAAPRVMARACAPAMSDFFAELHRSHGVEVLPDTGVAKIEGTGGCASAVIASDGRRFPADLVVVGIGIVPNVELARACGLAVGNGVTVDGHLRASDPAIFAIGDCCEFPSAQTGTRVRLESVQNAVDQGRAVAAAIVGRARPYDAVPWFWTDQYDAKVQIAGLSNGFDRTVLRGEPKALRFSLFYFRSGRLIAVDSVNRGADYMAVRKILGSGRNVTADEIADESVDLKTLLV